MIDKTSPTSRAGKPRLLRPASLLVIAGVLIVALVLLFPARRFKLLSHNEADNQAASGVSIQYLTSLLEANPNDRTIRLNLAAQLVKAGKLERARQVMAPLATSDDLAVRWLRLQLAWQAFNAAKPDAPQRPALRAALLAQMKDLSSASAALSTDRVDTLAKRWLAVDRPAQAAALYSALARRDTGHAYHWHQESARWWLAAGQPSQAATELFAALNATEDPAQRHQAALSALAAARQTDSDQSVLLAQRLIKQYPGDPALLDQAIDIALSRNRLALAQSWSTGYLAIRPDEQKALERDIRISLARSRLQDALATSQTLVAQHPNDLALREQLAEIQLWNGDSDAALGSYEILAQQHPDDRYDQRIIGIGQQVYDTRAVLDALDRIRRRHPLSGKQRKLLLDVLDTEGDPDRAIRTIRQWVDSGPAPRSLWLRLATLEEQTGALKASLHSWQSIARLFGRQLDETQARARLDLYQWNIRAALPVLVSLPNKPKAGSKDAALYWSTLGRIAWQLDDKTTALIAYQHLMDGDQLDEAGYQRLIRVAASSGDIGVAMRAARKGWKRQHAPGILLSMLSVAETSHRPDMVKTLLALARQRPSLFADSADYWQFVGNRAFSTHDLARARLAYLRALAIEPSNVGDRAALLYTLAEAGRTAELQRYLSAWQQDAADEPELWQAYAMAHSQLGQTRRAIPWFERSVRRAPDNYLLILDYADALESARRFESARRMRQYAVLKLRPRLIAHLQVKRRLSPNTRQQDSRILATQAEFLGPDQGRAWLARMLRGDRGAGLDAVDSEMLFSYYLGQNQPAYARYWLLRGERRRLATADWQKLAVAMQQNDQVEMQRLITAQGDGTIGLSDRINTLHRLGFDGKALNLALDHSRPGEPYAAGGSEVQRYAAQLYQDMPQNAGSRLHVRRVSDLDISDEQLFSRLSGEKWSLGAQLGARQLSHAKDIELSGLDSERYLSLDVFRRERRGQTRFTLGTVQADATDLWQFSFRQDWQSSERLNLSVFGDYNEQASETSRLRVLGTRDRLGASLSYVLSARDTVNLSANYAAFHSRRGRASLGQGYVVESSFAHALILGPTEQLQIRAFANTEQNTLARRLPADVAARLPEGSTPSSLIPARYSFIGSGFTLSRGQPGSEYPTVASPRYALDVDAGYVLPDKQFGVSANLSVGTRVLGSDELSFSLGVDQTGSNTRQNSYTGMIQYRYFFGR